MIRALVVDDYQEHVDTLVNTLNMYGCEARGASEGPEALMICETWQPHLVICDGLLEGMRAWKFGHALLSQDPPMRPYLVALTGFASRLQRRLCEECGFDEYVTKPIELSTLLTWVQKARQRAEQVPG
ncbi:MAG TPA: response regulator [Planctomycetota bacterium]